MWAIPGSSTQGHIVPLSAPRPHPDAHGVRHQHPNPVAHDIRHNHPHAVADDVRDHHAHPLADVIRNHCAGSDCSWAFWVRRGCAARVLCG